MSEGSGQLKRADLRAFVGSVEGLYPFEGVVRFTGISEGFTGKVERCPYLTEGVVPQGGPVPKNLRNFYLGNNFYEMRAPHFPTQGSLVKVYEVNSAPLGFLFFFSEVLCYVYHPCHKAEGEP